MNKSKIETTKFFKNKNLTYAFDNLTKVLNREMITSYLASLIAEGTPFTLCLCDIDNFKNVNDTYGHMAGDEVLIETSALIERVVGNHGLVGRYGGDEFMIILDNIVEYNDVWSVCHNINMSLAKLKFSGFEDLSVSLTTGISRHPLDGNTYEQMVQTADKALYRGKIKGRNCFIIYLEAKHSQIMLQKKTEQLYNSVDMLTNVITVLGNDDTKAGIEEVINYLSSTLSINHIAINSTTKECYKVVHPLSKRPEFDYIPINLIRRSMNSYGLFFTSKIRTLYSSGAREYYQKLADQEIAATLSVLLEYNGKEYGYIVANSIDNRVWQSIEMDVFTVAAKMLSYILYKADITLDDIYK